MSDSDEDLAALDTICAQEYLMFVRDIGYGLIICHRLQLFESDMLLAADWHLACSNRMRVALTANLCVQVV